MKNLLTKKKIGSKLTVVMLLSLAFTNYVSASYEITQMPYDYSNPYDKLVSSIKNMDMIKLSQLIDENKLDVNHQYKNIHTEDPNFRVIHSAPDGHEYFGNETKILRPLTPLDLAVYYKNLDAVNELLKRGANLDSVFENEQYFNNDDRAELYNYLRPIKDAQKAVLKYSEAKQSYSDAISKHKAAIHEAAIDDDSIFTSFFNTKQTNIDQAKEEKTTAAKNYAAAVKAQDAAVKAQDAAVKALAQYAAVKAQAAAKQALAQYQTESARGL